MSNGLANASTGTRQLFRLGFIVAALYDCILGLVFFFLHGPIFEVLEIVPPDNLSYIHLTAAYVFVQGVGYWFVAFNMTRNVDLVKLGIVYKVIYIGIAIYYVAAGDLLSAVFAWFAVCDVAFLLLFGAFLFKARSR